MIEIQERVQIYDDEKRDSDLHLRSWFCSIKVDSSSVVNLKLLVNHIEIGLINLILGGI